MVLLALTLLVIVGLALTLDTERFEPHPSLAPARAVVTVLAAVSCPLLLASVGQDWWTIEDLEAQDATTTGGTSWFPVLTVAAGVLGAVLTVAAARGRRNWAPLLVAAAWLLVGLGWLAASGEGLSMDTSGTTGPGLRLATWSLLPVTVAALLGSLTRRAERRRGPSRPGDRR